MTERLIKDRLVIRIRDDKAREKLLAKEQLDLETCIDNKMLQITYIKSLLVLLHLSFAHWIYDCVF